MCRLHLAHVWVGKDGLLMGINWFHDLILLPVSVFIHNYFIAPFQPMLKDVPDVGFPLIILEVYDDFFNDSGIEFYRE